MFEYIHHPALAQFLEEYGPGLHHIGFAVKDISKGVEDKNTYFGDRPKL